MKDTYREDTIRQARKRMTLVRDQVHMVTNIWPGNPIVSEDRSKKEYHTETWCALLYGRDGLKIRDIPRAGIGGSLKEGQDWCEDCARAFKELYPGRELPGARTTPEA